MFTEVYKYNQNCSTKVDDNKGLAAAATNIWNYSMKRIRPKMGTFLGKAVGKLLKTDNTRPLPLYLTPCKIPLVSYTMKLNPNIKCRKRKKI